MIEETQTEGNTSPAGLYIPELPEDVDTLTAGLAYIKAGWFIGPIARGDYKNPGSVLGKSWQTKTFNDAENVAAHFAGTDHGIFLHVGRSGAVALDVDNPAELPALLIGAFHVYSPPMQTSRREGSADYDPRRAHYLFLMPPGRNISNSKGGIPGAWGDVRGRNGVIIVAPSVHAKAEEGGHYRWTRTGPVPAMPAMLADVLNDANDAAGAVSNDEVTAFLAKHTENSRPEVLDWKLKSLAERFAAGEGRHDTTVAYSIGAMAEAACGYYPAAVAVQKLKHLFTEAAVMSRPGAPEAKVRSVREAGHEFASIIAYAVGQMAITNLDATRARVAQLDAKIAAAQEKERQEEQELVDMVIGANGVRGPEDDGDDDPGPGDGASSATDDDEEAMDTQTPVNTLDALTDKRRAIITHADQAATLTKRLLVGRWVFTKELGWLHWDGKRWAETPMEAVRTEIMHFYRAYVDRKQAEVIAKAADPKDLTKQEKQYLAALQGLLSKTSLDAVTSLASGLVLKPASIFDAHPDLLNARNGVVDLRTGQLQPHDPRLYLMKIANIDYRPETIDTEGLETILGCVPDDETREWLQVRFGQAATGYPPPDDLLTVLHGGGSNGKSTLLGGVQHSLGDYAITLDDKVLIGDSNSHSTEKTDLLGARLALAEEVPGGVELNMSSIKKITGSTKIKARKMRMDTIEWFPTHSIFLTSNYQPIVKATDHGTWRRLAKVTFPLRYRDPHDVLEGPDDRRGDPALRARVEDRDEKLMSGFLAWMVEGARRWYEKDRVMPAVPTKVVKETLEWRAETDLIMGFVGDTLEFEPQSYVLVTEAYEEFVSWMEKAGMRPWSLTIFKARFLEHSAVVAHRVTTGRTRTHADLSRPPRMARMTLPTGPAMVFHGVAFGEGEQPRFRVVSD